MPSVPMYSSRPPIPKRMFLTSGVGVHQHELTSFESALRDAGIAKFNLVYVSSILPPGCKRVGRSYGLKFLSPGEMVYCVMARIATNEPNRLIVSSLGIAQPSNQKQHGYISEHHAYGLTDERAGNYAEDLAASMLASTIGIKFDPDEAWDSRRQAFRLSGKIVRTSHIAHSARGDTKGKWTTVIAAAVFIFPYHLEQGPVVE